MLPMYWRGLHEGILAANRALPSLAWVIVPGGAAVWQTTITVYEDSLLKFIFSGVLDRVTNNGWETALFRIQDTTNAVTVASGAGFAYHTAVAIGTAGRMSVSMLGYATQNAAAPATTYEVQYAVYATPKLQLINGAAFGVEIKRT